MVIHCNRGCKIVINNMKNKKAWMRIVEAVIGILLIMGFLVYFISQKTTKSDISQGVYDRQMQILDVISKNDSIRTSILSDDNTEVNDYIKNMIPASWNFTTHICAIQDICNRAYTPYDREVYATEILITSNITDYQPKKLRFFVWVK